MRASILLLVLGLSACTASVDILPAPVSERATEACSDLAALCSTTGDCSARLALCGSDGQLFNPVFATESACKSDCNGDTGCLRACKLSRISTIQTYLGSVDLDGDGVLGDGTAACAGLSSTCASTGQGCLAGEFFCVAAAPAPSSCSTALDACKAACAPHDRTCLHACRDTYRQCTSMPTTTSTTYNLTYGTTAGSTGSGTVTVNPAGTSCGASCATYASGTMVTLTATPSTGSTFTKWVGCSSTTNTCTVTMTAVMTVTATFSQNTTTTYDLMYGTTAGSTGSGTVTLNPAGTSCGMGCASFPSGTSVTLTATPSSGSTLSAWVGCTSTSNKCTVTVTSAMTITATFAKTTTTTSYTYTTDIAPKMTGLCNGCHTGSGAPGGYLTDSYTGLFGNGSDGTPNIIAGNGGSLFVQKIAGNHHNVLTQYPGFDKVTYDWVVSNNAVK